MAIDGSNISSSMRSFLKNLVYLLYKLNSSKYDRIIKIEFGHDSQFTDRVCNPVISHQFENNYVQTSRVYGINDNCPKTWKVDVDVNQSFESWYTSNVQYNADKYVTSFNGAVGK